MTTTTTEFAPADRYLYDFGLCSLSNGWAQIDTRQDASYFGTWIHPEKRLIFCYCEGDTTLTQSETDEELVAEFKKIDAWNLENFNQGAKIDPGWNHDNEIAQRLKAAGLGEYLH